MVIGNGVCTCKNCGKRFWYGDENSPMLNNSVWNEVVNALGLREYEIQAKNKFDKAYNSRRNVADNDAYHLYLCTDCMEMALGRKLTPNDMIGDNVPLNRKFEKKYFNKK